MYSGKPLKTYRAKEVIEDSDDTNPDTSEAVDMGPIPKSIPEVQVKPKDQLAAEFAPDKPSKSGKRVITVPVETTADDITKNIILNLEIRVSVKS